MDSLPHELHLAILTSLSVRDIHRLGRTNKEWNKKSKDLSFLTTLDFSYSPVCLYIYVYYYTRNFVHKKAILVIFFKLQN
jgi:hypothetical protein